MFAIDQEVFEDGEWSDDAVHDYREGLFAAFCESPEGQACREHLGELGWTHTFLDLAMGYVGATPPRMSRQQFNEVLFELIPRKISTDADSAVLIVTELRAFWEFLDREYHLPHAAALAAALDGKAESRLNRELANPANFGVGKSFFMMGKELGFDMTTQEGLDEFINHSNSALVSRLPVPLDDDDYDDGFDPRFEPNSLVPRQRAALLPPHRTADERRALNKARQKQLQALKRRRGR
jgi:hypothetical protein